MNKLSDLTGALEKMNEATFQQFGDEFLGRIYHPINFEPRGSMIGKDKTKKGSPDTIFVLPEGKVMIEYTTQSSSSKVSFLQKLKSDIDSCLDYDKTRVPIEEICEIVIFTNQRIAIDTIDELESYFKNKLINYNHDIKLKFFSLDNISLKTKDYPGLMMDYLGISCNSNCLELKSFVKKFSNNRISYPIPLDNKYFEIESFPISKGVDILAKNDVVVISGNPGMGKTRYAVEIAESYAAQSGSISYVLEENSQDVRATLNVLDSERPYVFIIDDANRTSIWEEAVEYYAYNCDKNVKLIATVRDYALESVIDKCSSLKSFHHIKISKSTEDIIVKILTSFGITTPLWHNRIKSIVGENIRLAVMCGQIALNGNKYDELMNVESVYDIYYKPILKNVTAREDRNLLKVLAIIDFYKVVDLEEDSLLRHIETIFNISKSDFIETCIKLNSLECIDLTGQKLVTIPDQNFGNYMFYQCFFVFKELSLSTLIINYYKRKDRISDSIFSVCNCFIDKQVDDYLKKSVHEAWMSIIDSGSSEDDKEEFLNQFGVYIPFETFRYVRDVIHGLDKNVYQSAIYGSDSIISILSKFYFSSDYEINIALDLMADYLEINRDKLSDAVSIICEHWVFDEYDYYTSYKRQSAIIDIFIKISHKGEVGFDFASKVLPEYLKFIYQDSIMKGRKFTTRRYSVIVTDELMKNRKTVWKWIIDNISKIDQVEFINKLYWDFYNIESIAKEIVDEEITYLNDAISFMDISNNLNLCYALKDLTKRVARIISKKKLIVDWSRATPLYKLDCLINANCDCRISEKFDTEKNNIGNIIKSKSLSELVILIDDIVQIADLKESKGLFRVSFAIEMIMPDDLNMAMSLWQYIIDKGYDYIPSRILSTYIDLKYDINDLLIFIGKQNQEVKADLIFTLICSIEKPYSYISELDFYNAIIGYHTIIYDLNFIVKKFFPDNKLHQVYRSIMAAVLCRVRMNKSITDCEEFLREFCFVCPTKLNIIEKVYIYGLQKNSNFDYEHKLLIDILKIDPCFWVKCCKEIKCCEKDYHIAPYRFIWNLENYSQIIEITLLYYANKNRVSYDDKKNIYSFFSNIKGDKADDFVNSMIIKYCRNNSVICLLFEIVFSCFGNSKVQHYITFVSHNDNIEDFKKLRFTPGYMYGGYSFATTYKANMNFVSALFERISSLSDNIKYMDHLCYLDELKRSLQDRYESELKTDHKNRLYDL